VLNSKPSRKLTLTVVGQQLGFKKFIPPFANIIGSDILKGVNYASGAAGIREETGKHNLVSCVYI
jgi:hypothetical protein